MEEHELQRVLCGVGREGGGTQPREKSILRRKVWSAVWKLWEVKGRLGQNHPPLSSELGVSGEHDGTCSTRKMGEGTLCWRLKENREERIRVHRRRDYKPYGPVTEEHNKPKQPK